MPKVSTGSAQDVIEQGVIAAWPSLLRGDVV